MTQSFKGEIVVSRLWDFNQAMKNDLKEILDLCVPAFVQPGSPASEDQAEVLLKGLLSAAACTADAKNLTESEVFAFLGSGGPPMATKAPACAN
jgi:hypothetical protein